MPATATKLNLKSSLRFKLKVDRPINLKALASDASLKLILGSHLDSENSFQIPFSPNISAEQQQILTSYLKETLHSGLHKELFDRAVLNYYGGSRIGYLMNVLSHNCIGETVVDLIGPYRGIHGFCNYQSKTCQTYGFLTDMYIDKAHCDTLYEKINQGNLKNLRCLSIVTDKDALKTSNFPSIIARAEALHTVVILNGATDHILRLLGLNCHSLKFLDVTCSQSVTNEGLRNLLLKSPRQPADNLDAEISNPCASSISRIAILGTKINSEGQEFGSRIIGGYFINFFPDLTIFKPQESQLVTGFPVDWRNQLFVQQITEMFGFSKCDAEAIKTTASTLAESELHVEDEEERDTTPVFDCFSDNKGKAQLLIRLPDSRFPKAHLRMEANAITHLVLPFNNGSHLTVPQLTELATSFPNLTILKTALRGTWDWPQSPLWPKLKHTDIWTSQDSIVTSFLQYCPAIETFKFTCINDLSLEPQPSHHMNTVLLDDTTVHNALINNTSLRNSLVEVSISGDPRLITPVTVNFFVQHCPNLLRLGDLQSWNVSHEDIIDLNKTLDDINSQCILTVLAFPPIYKVSDFM